MTPLRRRNLVAVLVFSVALAIIGVTRIWPQWSDYRATTVPAVAAPRGASAQADGQTWQVDGVDRSAAGAGLQHLTVTVRRSGAHPSELRSGVLTDGTRRWSAVAAQDGTDRLRLDFDIPVSAQPAAVDLTGPDGRIALRLDL